MKEPGQARNRPRELYYGWVIVAALFLSVLVFWGALYSFGVFLKPLSQEFGWSRAQTSWAFAVSMGVQGVVGILAGVVTDRFGPRLVMLVSCLFTALGYSLVYFTGSLWHLYISYGVLAAIGTGASWVVAIATVPRWFARSRGLALGVVLASIGVGQMVLPPLLTRLTLQSGWRLGFVVIAALVVLIGVPSSLLLRAPRAQATVPGAANDPKGPIAEGPSVREALTLPSFWALFALWFLVAIPLQLLIVHMVPYATDARVSPAQAAFLLTMMGGTVTAARIGIGWVSDLVENRYAYWLSLLLQVVALFWMVIANDFVGFAGAVSLFGVGYGGGAILFPKIVADLYGVKAIGAIIGILGIGWTVGAVVGPPLGGLVFDTWGSYAVAFLGGGVIMGLALFVAYGLLRRKAAR